MSTKLRFLDNLACTDIEGYLTFYLVENISLYGIRTEIKKRKKGQRK